MCSEYKKKRKKVKELMKASKDQTWRESGGKCYQTLQRKPKTLFGVLNNMKDENSIVVMEEGKIMKIWKRYQTLLDDEETEEEKITPLLGHTSHKRF